MIENKMFLRVAERQPFFDMAMSQQTTDKLSFLYGVQNSSINRNRLFFLRAKRTKNLGAFRIRPEPLTGRAWGSVDYPCSVAGCPAPTRFTVCGGADYLTTIVKNTKVLMFFAA
jgi:hypothetical protein